MSFSTRIHEVPIVHFEGLEGTLCIARLDLPGGIIDAEAMMKEDCKGMSFRFVDLPGACNGDQVGANMPLEIERAISRDRQEELDGLELINNTPHRVVPISFPEAVEPYFINIDQTTSAFGDRENAVVYRNIPGTTHRIALVGCFSKRKKPIRVQNNYVPTREEILRNVNAFFGNCVAPVNLNAVPRPPHPPVKNNDALLQQLFQRIQTQEAVFQCQLEEQQRQTWMTTLHTMANADVTMTMVRFHP